MSSIYSRTYWPFLTREWQRQMQRQRQGALGRYPGYFWAACALTLPILASQFDLMSRSSHDYQPLTSWVYILSGLWLLWLSCLRACMGSAINMAEDVRWSAISTLRQLHGNGGALGILFTKALVVGVPLVFEWTAFLGVSLLLEFLDYSLPIHPLRFVSVSLCATGFFLALGSWLGTRIGDPERAGNNARVAVVMTLIGWGLLESVLSGPLLLGGLLGWGFLIFRSSPRFGSVVQVVATTILLSLCLPHSTELHLYEFSPLSAAVQPALTQQNCGLYLVGALLIYLWNARQLRRF